MATYVKIPVFGLELVSSSQHRAKNMLEMFAIQHTSI